MTAYRAFLAEKPMMSKRPLHEDSLAKLIIDFYGSRLFMDRKPSTRRLYRYALDPVSKEHGHRSASSMTADNAEKIINKIGAKRPGMGNLTRAVLRRVMHFAVKQKIRKDNPLLGIEAFKVGEHHTWNDAELKQYEGKWRLGTRQIIGTICIQYRAVVFDLEEKILHHPLRQIEPLVPNQATNDEITVPAVHLIESSTGHDILARQIKQSGRINFARIDFAEIVNDHRQMLGLDVALFSKLLNGGGNFEVRRYIEHGGGRQFRINDGLAIGQRTSQRIPARSDVFANRSETLFLGDVSLRLRGARSGSSRKKPPPTIDLWLVFPNHVAPPLFI